MPSTTVTQPSLLLRLTNPGHPKIPPNDKLMNKLRKCSRISEKNMFRRQKRYHSCYSTSNLTPKKLNRKRRKPSSFTPQPSIQSTPSLLTRLTEGQLCPDYHIFRPSTSDLRIQETNLPETATLINRLTTS